MQNLIFKGLNGRFKIAATTQYITRIKIRLKIISKRLNKIKGEWHFFKGLAWVTDALLHFTSKKTKCFNNVYSNGLKKDKMLVCSIKYTVFEICHCVQ